MPCTPGQVIRVYTFADLRILFGRGWVGGGLHLMPYFRFYYREFGRTLYFYSEDHKSYKCFNMNACSTFQLGISKCSYPKCLWDVVIIGCQFVVPLKSFFCQNTYASLMFPRSMLRVVSSLKKPVFYYQKHIVTYCSNEVLNCIRTCICIHVSLHSSCTCTCSCRPTYTLRIWPELMTFCCYSARRASGHSRIGLTNSAYIFTNRLCELWSELLRILILLYSEVPVYCWGV